MSYRQRRALGAIRNDSNIVTVLADKGRTTVVMDKEDYYIKRTLQIDKYHILQKDPTVNRENKIANTLKALHAQGHIDAQLRDFITPCYSTPSQMYGLPKIHKEGTLMQPIVSTINSPTYKIAKELTRILTPLAGHPAYTVKNSTAFVSRIQDIQMTPEDKRFSFDVKSLFTEIPVEAALKVVEEKVTNDQSLAERTNIPTDKFFRGCD